VAQADGRAHRIQKILKSRFQLPQIRRGFKKLKINPLGIIVRRDAPLDGLVAAHHVDSFSRIGLASGEFDRPVAPRLAS